MAKLWSHENYKILTKMRFLAFQKSVRVQKLTIFGGRKIGEKWQKVKKSVRM